MILKYFNHKGKKQLTICEHFMSLISKLLMTIYLISLNMFITIGLVTVQLTLHPPKIFLSKKTQIHKIPVHEIVMYDVTDDVMNIVSHMSRMSHMTSRMTIRK